MSKAVFTMKLDEQLREEFMTVAKAEDRPASQVVRELMRGYIEKFKNKQTYEEFLQEKVNLAREQRENGEYFSNDVVEEEAKLRQSPPSTILAKCAG